MILERIHNYFCAVVMTNFIPIFPLEIVVYPGEKLNLHIFEPKYKQLISECYKNKKPFGIPPVLKNKIAETVVIRRYADRHMLGAVIKAAIKL